MAASTATSSDAPCPRAPKQGSSTPPLPRAPPGWEDFMQNLANPANQQVVLDVIAKAKAAAPAVPEQPMSAEALPSSEVGKGGLVLSASGVWAF
eukprot:4202909-Alexandrium_andersonii.AAC.1